MLGKYRADIFALFAYAFLAILLTYPLLLHFATHVSGDGSDDPALAWNLWWVPYAIIKLGISPIYTQHMFYPIGLNLAFYTLTYLNAFIAVPIQYAFNLIVAANVNLLLSFVLSGYGAYLLSKYLLGPQNFQSPISRLIPFAAGALYAFSSNKFLYASLGQFNIASSQWIPFYVLFLVKLVPPSPRSSPFSARAAFRYGFFLGLFLLFQALSEFIFASFLIIFTAIYIVYWIIVDHRQLLAYRFLFLAFLIAVLVFLVPMLPILAAMIQDLATEGDIFQHGLGFADVFSSDLLGFIIPSHLSPLFGNYESQFHFAYINFAYLGYAALLLAAIAIWKAPQARIWAGLAAIFILITLGPTLRVNGSEYAAPFLPFNLLLDIPIVKGNRYPSRWSVMVTLALAVMVGYGLAWASEKLKAKSSKLGSLLAFSFLLFALVEHLSIPLPLSNLQIPDVYQTIARDPGNFTVLEIPLAWRNGFRMTGTLDQAMMFEQWYQTEHGHPILGGNTSRNPELKFQYFTEAPVINSIIAVETGHELDPDTLARDKTLAPDVLRFFGIRYIVWHSPRDPQNRFALDAARAYVENILPVAKFYEVSDESGDIVAYRVNDSRSTTPVTIRPNDPLARLNFAEGWGALGGYTVWATRRQAKLFWRLDQPRDATISFSAAGPLPLREPLPNQYVTVIVNGHESGRVELTPHLAEYSVNVSRNLWQAGMNEITLEFDSLDRIEGYETFAYSAGSEVGDFAHIYVNGVDESPNERGYNVVVIDPRTGRVESRATFDTFASEENSAKLAQFIARIQDGKLVGVAVRDEASRNLTEDAVQALRTIGASQDLRGKFRWSHAIVGIKGASSADDVTLESASEIAPAQAVLGAGAMEPYLAAGFEWIMVK
jgi:interleukin-like EMT inducer protein